MLVDRDDVYQHIPGVLPPLEIADMATVIKTTHQKYYNHVEEWHMDTGCGQDLIGSADVGRGSKYV